MTIQFNHVTAESALTQAFKNNSSLAVLAVSDKDEGFFEVADEIEITENDIACNGVSYETLEMVTRDHHLSIGGLEDDQDPESGAEVPGSMVFTMTANDVARFKAALKNNLLMMGLASAEDVAAFQNRIVEHSDPTCARDIVLSGIETNFDLPQYRNGEKSKFSPLAWKWDPISEVSIHSRNSHYNPTMPLQVSIALVASATYFYGSCRTTMTLPLQELIEAVA